MAFPVPAAALKIYVDANPEAWFSRLRDQAHCSDLGRATKSVRNREILLVNLLQKQGGKPDGHHKISGKTHPPLSRVLARAMLIDKTVVWCLPDDGSLALFTEEKEEDELTKRFRAQVDVMSVYNMVKRLEEEGWIEEASRIPSIVPRPHWQVDLQEEVNEALDSAMAVETELCKRSQEAIEKARMRPGEVALMEELAKIDKEKEKEKEKVELFKGLLESLSRYLSRRKQNQHDLQVLMIDPIKTYLSVTVHLFWATASLVQLASCAGVVMPESNDKARQRAGRILRKYVTAVLCAEKGSQIVNAQEEEVAAYHIRAGQAHLAPAWRDLRGYGR